MFTSAQPAWRVLLPALLLAVLNAACGPRSDQAASGAAIRLMVWNLDGWRDLDRDGGFQADDPKPESERQAVVATIVRERPDLLIALDLGSESDLADLRQALRTAGLDMPFGGFAGDPSDGGVAVLGKTAPLGLVTHRPGDYRIESSGELRARPALDVRLESFHLVTAFLRETHSGARGQDYEVRRNEARLMGQWVANLAKASSNLVVAGTFNDDPDSPTMRSIRAWRDEERVEALSLKDRADAGWTRQVPGKDQYDRRDYLLVSPSLKERWMPEESRVVELPNPVPSRHRPLLAVFRAEPAASSKAKP